MARQLADVERFAPRQPVTFHGTFFDLDEAAGCTGFNLIPQAPEQDQALAGVASVRALLSGARAT